MLFGLIPGVALAATQESFGAFLIGSMFTLFTAALFTYVAWDSYETPRPVVDHGRAKRTALFLLAGRMLLYLAFVVVALTVAEKRPVLAAGIIFALVATQVALSILLSKRMRRTA